jgi:hypothetical protein
MPFTEIRVGRFRRHATRAALSFAHRDHVLTLTLDPRVAGYVGAIGLDDPDTVAAAIESARRP